MKKYWIFPILMAIALILVPPLKASGTGCQSTGWGTFTAAMVNPGNLWGNTVDATGCDIGVYFSGQEAQVLNVTVHGALYYGVVVHGDSTMTSVDILNSTIYDIGDSPVSGNQRGVGVYYRAFFAAGSATGRVSGNRIFDYQKGGIVVNGPGSNVQVQNNEVTGFGPVTFIAQNGIQFGYGSSGSAIKNTVKDNSYDGPTWASGGILVVGGPGYGTCPDGNACLLTAGIQIVQNVIDGNDVGAYLSNWDVNGAPSDQTNIKVVNNDITNERCINAYQAGVSDVGNNDKMINNRISGAGYSAGCGITIDADSSFTNRPKVHANK